MTNSYQDNSIHYHPPTNPLTLHESTPTPFTERHIQCLWADHRQRPKNLRTADNQPIQLHHPGHWNHEAGPDFLNAELSIGTPPRRLRGDLEIHIHPTHWHHHRHSHDPNYANVRFHLVHFPGPDIPGLIQIPLQPLLQNNPRHAYENIDPAAYPFGHADHYPCAHLPPTTLTAWLQAAGHHRLHLKTQRLTTQLQQTTPPQLLWIELLAALGYKQNSAPLRQLAHQLPLEKLQSHPLLERYALLLGTAGLLPTTPPATYPPQTRRFIRQCWDIWWKQPQTLKDNALPPTHWQRSGLRPLNHPRRRLMAAACLAPHGIDLLHNPQRLTQLNDPFWTHHLTWEKTCPPTQLIGTPRANAIHTNILLPLRTALGLDPQLHTLKPEPLNRLHKQTAHALLGTPHSPRPYATALARQGLIQIFHDYVAPNRLHELTPPPNP